MSSTKSEGDSWKWVVSPEETRVHTYAGNDLSESITTGARVSEIRHKAGLSTQEVEDYAGVSKSNLLAIEAGLLTLDREVAEQLSMVLGVSVTELMG